MGKSINRFAKGSACGFTMKLDNVQKKILLIYVVLITIGITYTVLIYTTGFGIPCMFNRFTGYLCPGCGTSRMALAMLRLDFYSAFRFNPVAFVTVILWLMISIGCFAGRPAVLRNERVLLGAVCVDIAVYLIFAVLRNL